MELKADFDATRRTAHRATERSGACLSIYPDRTSSTHRCRVRNALRWNLPHQGVLLISRSLPPRPSECFIRECHYNRPRNRRSTFTAAVVQCHNGIGNIHNSRRRGNAHVIAGANSSASYQLEVAFHTLLCQRNNARRREGRRGGRRERWRRRHRAVGRT
jgi:hypothetical protein